MLHKLTLSIILCDNDFLPSYIMELTNLLNNRKAIHDCRNWKECIEQEYIQGKHKLELCDLIDI